MKKLLLACVFLLASSSAFAGLIFTDTGEVSVQDVYDNIDLTYFGNTNLSKNSSVFIGSFTLPEQANILVFDTPAVDFLFNELTQFTDVNGNVLSSFFTLSGSFTSQPTVAFYSSEGLFKDVFLVVSPFYSPAVNSYLTSGVWVKNIRYGTYTHIAHPPSTSVDGPTTISIFLLGIAGVFYIRRKKQMIYTHDL